METIYEKIASKIIKEQELVMGSVAWQEALKVAGLTIVDQKSGEIHIDKYDEARTVVDDLVGRYESLFGRAARQVCIEAVGGLVAELSQTEVPETLQR